MSEQKDNLIEELDMVNRLTLNMKARGATEEELISVDIYTKSIYYCLTIKENSLILRG